MKPHAYSNSLPLFGVPFKFKWHSVQMLPCRFSIELEPELVARGEGWTRRRCPLARHLIARYVAESGRRVCTLSSDPNSRLKELQVSADREKLAAALIKSEGDCVVAARVMGKSQATVYRWVKEFELTHLLKRPRQ